MKLTTNLTNDQGGFQDKLSLNIAGVHFRNPVIAASGTFGYGREYKGLLDIAALGGICTKGLTLTARRGNGGTRLWETASGLLNSIGLENPGIEAFIEKELPRLNALGPVVIANLSGGSIDEYRQGAELLSNSSVDMIELNISCPNVKSGGVSFGLTVEAAVSVVKPVRSVCKKPLIVKLSPSAPNLAAVARACEENGADALSLVNTFTGMAIDIHKRRPVFDNITAGLSGPAIRPLALRMVWELYGQVNIPVIGLGGIACADDAIEFLMAGAAAIQVGSATFANPRAMNQIISGIETYMRKNGLRDINSFNLRQADKERKRD
ncbi:MAG: dihydroorotate dehydrogenase [Spirochaetaceae bacterium]|jgi:dihydroorotate dehydrogenase (NAD+) catalytic subunit|nr:dihydroorotate dehydrogenase [Spirochaetaceae bacterium]